MSDKNKELQQKKAVSLLGGGLARIAKQHEKGKLTARERIKYLLDDETFEEMGQFVTHHSTDFGLDEQKYLGDGVVTGYGTIDDRPVYIFAQDFTVFGGSLSLAHAQKICRVMDLAVQNGVPIIGLNDSGGARIQEGVKSLGGYADIFYRNARASGVIPQISAIMGPCAGGAVYSPAMTDFICMVRNTSYMFVTGPNVVKTVTKETVTAEQLGGASAHTSKSGVAHLAADTDMDCLDDIRKLLSYLPQSFMSPLPRLNYFINSDAEEMRPGLENILPESSSQPYDMHKIITEVIDRESFFELSPDYAKNIIIGFGRLEGNPIGIVANQPQELAGVLDVNASKKAARFVRFCDCFSIPLLVFEDVPGFLPGTEQEWNGIISNGAKLLFAFCEATVPRITVITRKAYGGAYDVMNSKHIGADYKFAWPTAEIAVMGAKGASEIIFKNEIKEADDPDALAQQKEKEYADKFATPYKAASYGYVDDVILPRESRIKLIKAFRTLETKIARRPQKKHNNLPL